MENSKKSTFTKIVVVGSGIAFLAGSVLSIGGMIGSSVDRPAVNENAAQSQNAQLAAQEKGFLGVLKREPKNQTALRGIKEIVDLRMTQGDVNGTRSILAQLVKIDPTNKSYQELLDAIDKQIAEAKKVGTLKPTEPTQPPKPSK